MLRFTEEHEAFFEAAANAGQSQRDVAKLFATKWPLYNPSTRPSMHALDPQTVEKNEAAYLERIVSAYKKRRAALNVAKRTRAVDAAGAPVVGTVVDVPAGAPVVALDDETVASKPAPVDSPSSVVEAVDALLRSALRCGAIDVGGLEGVSQLCSFVNLTMDTIASARATGAISSSKTFPALRELVTARSSILEDLRLARAQLADTRRELADARAEIQNLKSAPKAPADTLAAKLDAIVDNSRGLIDSISTLAASQLNASAAHELTIETQKQYIAHLERLAGLGK